MRNNRLGTGSLNLQEKRLKSKIQKNKERLNRLLEENEKLMLEWQTIRHKLRKAEEDNYLEERKKKSR